MQVVNNVSPGYLPQVQGKTRNPNMGEVKNPNMEIKEIQSAKNGFEIVRKQGKLLTNAAEYVADKVSELVENQAINNGYGAGLQKIQNTISIVVENATPQNDTIDKVAIIVSMPAAGFALTEAVIGTSAALTALLGNSIAATVAASIFSPMSGVAAAAGIGYITYLGVGAAGNLLWNITVKVGEAVQSAFEDPTAEVVQQAVQVEVITDQE